MSLSLPTRSCTRIRSSEKTCGGKHDPGVFNLVHLDACGKLSAKARGCVHSVVSCGADHPSFPRGRRLGHYACEKSLDESGPETSFLSRMSPFEELRH